MVGVDLMVGLDFHTKPNQPNIFNKKNRIFKQEKRILEQEKRIFKQEKRIFKQKNER